MTTHSLRVNVVTTRKEAGVKDPDYWPCGHPRTEENTRKCGVAGVRCKECRKAIDRKHNALRRPKKEIEK